MKFVRKKQLRNSETIRSVGYIHILLRKCTFLKVTKEIFLKMYLEDYTLSL